MTTALYRRYRPDSFDQVIGQDHVTEPLRAALRSGKVTHAYLFSGPRGCGKTTSARILARCLNCAQGPTDTPCGTCDSCVELATGGPGSLDVVEIDAASHGGVDDARDLRERAAFAPVRDQYKVFIIDEAHMVSTQGFNALLKLVEEPPEHVKFVFATTEPERVIGTIRSRTHHYPFRLVPPDVLDPFLGRLASEEGIAVAPGVLGLVERAGGGSVRDTLSVLDQLMAGSADGTLDYQRAVALLGYTDSALLDQTVDALAGGDGAGAFRVVERMVESGHDPRRFVEDLLRRLRDLLIIAVAGDGAGDVLAGTPSDQFERMQLQAKNWGPRNLSRAADLTDKALRAMVGATSPRLQLELLIGRILVPAPAVAAMPTNAPSASGAVPGAVGMVGGGAPREAEDSARFGAAQAREELRRKRGEGAAPTPAPEPTAASAPTRAETPVPAANASAPAASVQTERERPGASTDQMASWPTPQAPPLPAGEPATQESAAETPSARTQEPRTEGAGRDADMLRQRWSEVVERLASISRVAWTLVGHNGQLGGVGVSEVVIVFPTQGHVGAFTNGNRAADVERAIYEATGLSLSVRAQVGQSGGGEAVTTPGAQASESPGTHPGASAPGAGEPFPKAEAGPEASGPAEQEWTVSPPPEPVDEQPVHHEDAPTESAPTSSGWGEVAIPGGAAPQTSVPASSQSDGPRDAGPIPEPLEPERHESLEPELSVAYSHETTESIGDASSELPDAPPLRDPRTYPSSTHPSLRGSIQHAPTLRAVPSFDDDDDDDQEDLGESMTGWSEEAAVPGGGGVPTFDDEPAPQGVTSQADQDLQPDAMHGTPRIQVAARFDDSASIDDADVEASSNAGLPAVLEILGGTVIEEIEERQGW